PRGHPPSRRQLPDRADFEGDPRAVGRVRAPVGEVRRPDGQGRPQPQDRERRVRGARGHSAPPARASARPHRRSPPAPAEQRDRRAPASARPRSLTTRASTAPRYFPQSRSRAFLSPSIPSWGYGVVQESVLGTLSQISEASLGVFRGRDAVDRGVTRKQLARLHAARLVERVLADTYRLSAVPRSSEQELHAALLWAGDDAA